MSGRKVLVCLSGYPCRGVAEHGDFRGFYYGEEHIKDKLRDFETTYACAVWDNIGYSEVKKAYNPKIIISRCQDTFKKSIYPFISKVEEVFQAENEQWVEEIRSKYPGFEYGLVPMSQYMSQLFLRQAIIQSALRNISPAQLSEFDYFVVARYDLTERGSEDVRYMHAFNQNVQTFLESSGETKGKVVMPVFPQLNEGYPDMWFFFNREGFERYSEVYDVYCDSLFGDSLSEYQKLLINDWPYSVPFEHQDFFDPARFTNIEITKSEMKDNPKGASYMLWQTGNIHSYHKYLFAFHKGGYDRAFSNTSGALFRPIRKELKDNCIIHEKSESLKSVRKNIALLVYTHSSYADILRVFVGEFLEFWDEHFDLIVACEDKGVQLLSASMSEYNNLAYQLVLYDDSLQYTDRIRQVMGKLGDCSNVLFLHEDMIPSNKPDMSTIERLLEYKVSNSLMWLGLTKNTSYNDKIRINELICKASTGYRYVVQPSFISPLPWQEFLGLLPRPLTIWELEEYLSHSPDTVYFHDEDGSIRRGLYQFDLRCLPHISTAITKGKWNYLEYPAELDKISRKYNLRLDDRGCVVS